MLQYYIFLSEAGVSLMYSCMADDWNHAAEQALDAYKEGTIISITREIPYVNA